MVTNSETAGDRFPARNGGEAEWPTARLAREWQTMSAMVRIYCRDHHQPDDEVCQECRDFLNYARTRLQRCRFGSEKPTCANCPVHCYQRERREQARTLMRYAGPRMLWEHPILSLRHWVDGFRSSAATKQSGLS